MVSDSERCSFPERLLRSRDRFSVACGHEKKIDFFFFFFLLCFFFFLLLLFLSLPTAAPALLHTIVDCWGFVRASELIVRVLTTFFCAVRSRSTTLRWRRGVD